MYISYNEIHSPYILMGRVGLYKSYKRLYLKI